jgi:glutaredoxin domain-containing cysteine-rich protein 1
VYAEKGGFKTCTACNESGLIRCISCSCWPCAPTDNFFFCQGVNV